MENTLKQIYDEIDKSFERRQESLKSLSNSCTDLINEIDAILNKLKEKE